jgi:hypothetical protein
MAECETMYCPGQEKGTGKTLHTFAASQLPAPARASAALAVHPPDELRREFPKALRVEHFPRCPWPVQVPTNPYGLMSFSIINMLSHTSHGVFVSFRVQLLILYV